LDLEIKNIAKKYGNVAAVDDLTLSVEQGEFMTLLGPSGCGKTTVLRCIAGLEKLDSGQIYIQGKLVNDVPINKRNIGLVFQNYALFPHLTVFDNLAFGLKIKKLSTREIKEHIEKYLDLIKLPDVKDRYPNQLSGGQQQRIALIRSVIIEPALLLLDEPLSNLDFKLRIQMRTELTKIHKELGITTLYVTHDQSEAMSMSDRVAVIEQGKIKQVGTPREIYDNPKEKFVAEFIGEANIIEGKIIQRENLEMTVKVDDLTLTTPSSEEKAQETVYVSIRPESVKLSKKAGTTKNSFTGRIEAAEHLGPYIQYHIRLVDNLKIVANVPYSKQFTSYKAGEEIYASWDPTECTVI
jgi:putative spermidine/putrescine transport system ATP-binding protein